MSREITVVQLYPQHMNIYGDHGNALALVRRIEWLGYKPRMIEYNEGDIFPDQCDILLGGGGQDSGQYKIKSDLFANANRLCDMVEMGVPALMVCGMYQLYGSYFQTIEGDLLDGIGALSIYTIAKNARLIGNVVSQSEYFGKIVGYENHSGQSYFEESGNTGPLAKVIMGIGNNDTDKTEGAIYKNTIGTYLHGSLLPKNPRISDFLIEQACLRRYSHFSPQPVFPTQLESITNNARETALKLR
jgi:CobQ-like glutamine amidotransferase family enzyme